MGQNSLDAELGACGMLLENLRPWIVSKIWNTMTWAVCEGDVPIMVHVGVENDRVVEKQGLLGHGHGTD